MNGNIKALSLNPGPIVVSLGHINQAEGVSLRRYCIDCHKIWHKHLCPPQDELK